MEMRKIALATSHEFSDLTRDDRLVLNKLLYCGVDVEPVVWDSKDMAWNQFDALFIRSCWDYHKRYDDFFRWIDLMSSEGVVVFNNPDILRWNSKKNYLLELGEKGIPIVPTVLANKESPSQLQSLLQERDWKQAVIKPVVSANAYATWLTAPARPRENQEKLTAFLNQHNQIIVQKYIPEISSNGEWAMIYFDGEFSHSVLRKPADGDFRVQEDFGGTLVGKRPPKHLLEQADRVIEAIGHTCLYARVDGIEVDQKLLLMELELIEPSLYLDQHPKAPTRFAEAIITRMNDLPF